MWSRAATIGWATILCCGALVAGCRNQGPRARGDASPAGARAIEAGRPAAEIDDHPVVVDPAAVAVLPPALPWDGKSRTLALPPGERWATPCERSGLADTPRYDETVSWLRRLVAAAPQLKMVSIGRSFAGREIWMVIASADRAFTPGALRRSGRPTLLAQAGIHSGEIDGKDAGMMLLRALTVGGRQRALLERANLLLVPILNVDGHERFSAFSRSNQRGPREMGWRTNARNQNLNRDFAKLQTPEVRAVVGVLQRYDPELYLDLHVTDGADYQYDITFGFNGPHAHSPAIAAWGHHPGPLIFTIDDDDPAKGIVDWTASARFSQGYGDLRHLPAVLVENHSLKPHRQRVLGTYVLLAAALRTLGQAAGPLRAAIDEDRRRRRKWLPLAFAADEPARETVDFAAVAWRRIDSPIAGKKTIEWLGRPIERTVPLLRYTRVERRVRRPAAYWIPPSWPELIDRLQWHGVRLERIARAREVEVELLRVVEHEMDDAPYEGNWRVTVKRVDRQVQRERFPPGSVRVSTDQPLGDLAVALLEPEGPDSFFAWGMMLEVLQRGEYVEGYVIDPMARGMLQRDPALRRAFARRLANDPAFARDPRARRQWFYRRTPYFDERHRLYPIGREL
jgi:murein tripeptide amidase MpaA